MHIMDLISEAKTHVAEIDLITARDTIASGSIIIGVREPAEFADGHIKGAYNIPCSVLAFRTGSHPAMADPKCPVLLCCKSGGRSALTGMSLKRFGFEAMASIAGGLYCWQGVGLPVERDAESARLN